MYKQIFDEIILWRYSYWQDRTKRKYVTVTSQSVSQCFIFTSVHSKVDIRQNTPQKTKQANKTKTTTANNNNNNNNINNNTHTYTHKQATTKKEATTTKKATKKSKSNKKHWGVKSYDRFRVTIIYLRRPKIKRTRSWIGMRSTTQIQVAVGKPVLPGG